MHQCESKKGIICFWSSLIFLNSLYNVLVNLVEVEHKNDAIKRFISKFTFIQKHKSSIIFLRKVQCSTEIHQVEYENQDRENNLSNLKEHKSLQSFETVLHWNNNVQTQTKNLLNPPYPNWQTYLSTCCSLLHPLLPEFWSFPLLKVPRKGQAKGKQTQMGRSGQELSGVVSPGEEDRLWSFENAKEKQK